MSSPVKWPREKLDELIGQAQAEGKLAVQPEGGSPGFADSLRGALYRRLKARGISNFTLIRQGSTVLIVDNTPPEVKTQGEPPREATEEPLG